MPINFPFSIKESSKFDVVGFGVNAFDYLIRVSEYPAAGTKIELTSESRSPGGEAASTLAGLQRLGLKTAYAGRFGGDPEGALGLESLKAEGVDVSWAETIADARTQVGFIIVDDEGGERTVMWHRDPKLAYPPDAEPDHRIAVGGRVLHLTPHDTQMCIKLARAARQDGVVVSIDIDRVFDGIDELLPLVDVCIASAEFPQLAFGVSDPRDGLSEISRRYGCPVAGVTLGEKGSIFLTDGTIIEGDSFDVPGGCVDTTGAGDAFRAGFLFGMIKGQTVNETIRTAAAVAALKCRGIGARAALPDNNELRELLENNRH
jgi:sugar/nucleoside kinase (ribokinase family)